VEPPLVVVLVMAAACQDHLDQQAHPANPEDLANLVGKSFKYFNKFFS
jgi:hypothetical protein